MGLLMHPDMPDNPGVKKHGDVSCANRFRIGNKWMLPCISHDPGCRDYPGNFKEEPYLRGIHTMMNWKKGEFFLRKSIHCRWPPRHVVVVQASYASQPGDKTVMLRRKD